LGAEIFFVQNPATTGILEDENFEPAALSKRFTHFSHRNSRRAGGSNRPVLCAFRGLQFYLAAFVFKQEAANSLHFFL
jgi:hypothetical protein